MRNYFKLRFSKANWRTFCYQPFVDLCLALLGFGLCCTIVASTFFFKRTFENAVITKKYEVDIQDAIDYRIVFTSEGKKYEASVDEDEYKAFQLGKQTLSLPRSTYNPLYGLIGVFGLLSACLLIFVNLVFLCRFVRQLVYYREYIWYTPSYDKF